MSINTCVICQEETCTPTNPFLSPCSCKGSVSSIHRECLEQWIFHSNKTNCSVCHTKYRIILKEELVSTSRVILLCQAFLFYFTVMSILTGIFYLTNPNTYQFESKNIIDSISLLFLTTSFHLGIYLLYVVTGILIIIIILGTILCLVSMLTGESSGYDYHLHDMNGMSKIFENFLRTYPLQKSAISCWSATICSIVIGGLSIYLIYSFLKWRNQPTKKLRIQI
jgi:hypothetical protein